MKKKQKVIIFTVIGCLLAIIASLFIWFINSPFWTALNMVKAVQNQDADALIECIEPDTAEKIKLLLSFGGESFEDKLFENFKSQEKSDDEKTSSGKFAGYERDGDNAWFLIKTSDQENNTEKETKIPFVRVDGKWYLSLSEMTNQNS